MLVSALEDDEAAALQLMLSFRECPVGTFGGKGDLETRGGHGNCSIVPIVDCCVCLPAVCNNIIHRLMTGGKDTVIIEMAFHYTRSYFSSL